MKIEIELGFSHYRDAIAAIDATLARMVLSDQTRIGLQHLRDAVVQAIPPEMHRLLKGVTTAQSYHIKSKDGHYLTERHTWTRRKELRAMLSFTSAQREIEEARKWSPSAEIRPEV